MTKIKYCGLQSEEDVDVVNTLDIDFAGFIFASDRKRYIEPSKARQLKQILKPSIKAVGVFVDETAEQVAKLYQEGIIDVAQLHGNEDEEYLKRLRALCDIKIIKAFRIETADDIKIASKSSADMILLDNGAGGTGTCFDWELLNQVHRDYILAGGLNCDNIGNVIRDRKPFGVDVSSGIETDGRKDKEKMIRFEKIAKEEQ